ncbi:MAG: glycosyltransferase involved in cell wall biosynthesis [Myxococcota bacterium]|jgi:glycosyltransferase involved in cell wall biosynthesis
MRATRRESPLQSSALMYVAVPPPVTGLSVCTENLVERMRERAYPHAVVNYARPFKSGLAAKVGHAARAASLPVQGHLRARKLPGKVVTYLQVGASNQSFVRDLPILAHAKKTGSPVVAHLHNSVFKQAFDAAPRALRWALRHALRDVARVVVLAESLRDLFAGLVPDERVVVIDNGVERSVANRGAAARLERSGPELNVLFLSNLMAGKGYLEVMEAARLASERGLPHQFVMVGMETPTTSVLPDAFAQQHGLSNLTWPGGAFGSQKADYLERADVLVLPTALAEGQPLTLLEAMHFGRPVITSPSGAIPDLIRDGEHGALIPPRDPQAILAALERLSDVERWQTIARHNRAEAQRRFTLEAHGDAVISLLEEVAAEAERAG